jgi:hypothetical protein
VWTVDGSGRVCAVYGLAMQHQTREAVRIRLRRKNRVAGPNALQICIILRLEA